MQTGVFGLMVGFVVYITREDISTPYVKAYPRGWRIHKRRPVRVPVNINGQDMGTLDLSPAGLYVAARVQLFKVNESVAVTLSLAEEKQSLQGGIVRVDESGFGVAFRGMLGKTKTMWKHIARLERT